MASLRRLLALGLSLGLAAAQSITPVESRGSLTPGSPLYTISISPELAVAPPKEELHLYPAVNDLITPDQSLKDLRISGRLAVVGPNNANKLKDGDIAFVSCDPDDYPGNIDPDDTLKIVLSSSPRPAAILLFTTHDVRCEYSADPNVKPVSA
ncbi:hypothetical protein FQN49_001197, partial [Arthroderma sp. PD_2]